MVGGALPCIWRGEGLQQRNLNGGILGMVPSSLEIFGKLTAVRLAVGTGPEVSRPCGIALALKLRWSVEHPL